MHPVKESSSTRVSDSMKQHRDPNSRPTAKSGTAIEVPTARIHDGRSFRTIENASTQLMSNLAGLLTNRTGCLRVGPR